MNEQKRQELIKQAKQDLNKAPVMAAETARRLKDRWASEGALFEADNK